LAERNPASRGQSAQSSGGAGRMRSPAPPEDRRPAQAGW
jgi:hypothetical protein